MTTSIDYDTYQTFAEKVVNQYRFALDDESVEFQILLKATAEKRKTTIDRNQRLFRARKGCDRIHNGLFQPHPIKDMLAPPPDKAHEGRVNPKGIPCFYAADQFKTAVSELRPWVDEYISVAILNPFAELKVVDLTNDDEPSIVFKKCLNKALPESKPEIEKQIWSDINVAFSKPISIDDETSKYAPTQIISEWFKSWGYDGVVYKSSVHSEGKNYAFFDVNLFSANNDAGMPRVIKVTEIDLNYDPANTLLSVSQNKEEKK